MGSLTLNHTDGGNDLYSSHKNLFNRSQRLNSGNLSFRRMFFFKKGVLPSKIMRFAGNCPVPCAVPVGTGAEQMRYVPAYTSPLFSVRVPLPGERKTRAHPNADSRVRGSVSHT
jgi:hypothetical protein